MFKFSAGLSVVSVSSKYQMRQVWKICMYCFGIVCSNVMPQLGLDVGGSFNIHIWECSGDFIIRNR